MTDTRKLEYFPLQTSSSYTFDNVENPTFKPVLYYPQMQYTPVTINSTLQYPGEEETSSDCCSKDDGRSFGTFQNFIVSTLLATVSPLVSIIFTYGMETSKLSRLGSLFGTANAFILFAAALACCSQTIVALVSLIIGMIFMIISLKSWNRFLFVYITRPNKTDQESIRVITPIGTVCDFILTYIISVFFGVFGALACLLVKRKSLYGRYGAVSGFGMCILFSGMMVFFLRLFVGVENYYPFPQQFPVPFPLLIAAGIIIIEFSMVHFRRALVCAIQSPVAV